MFRCKAREDEREKKSGTAHQYDATDNQCLFRMPLIPMRFAFPCFFSHLLRFYVTECHFVLAEKPIVVKLNIYNLVIIF